MPRDCAPKSSSLKSRSEARDICVCVCVCTNYTHQARHQNLQSHCPLPFDSPNIIPPLVLKMLRAGAVRALYAATRTQVPRQLPALRTGITSSLQSSRVTPSFVLPSIRCYSAPAGLSKDEVQGRIMDLLKNFDKVRSEPSVSSLFSWLTTRHRSPTLRR